MSEAKLAFETRDYREHRIKALYLGEGVQNARIELWKADEKTHEFFYPAYKIWSLNAHMDEVIDSYLENAKPVQKMDKPDYPPAGTWDVVDRHGEPRYVVEHDGNGGWWGVCQPDRPEDCYVLAASKEMREALKRIKQRIHFIGWPSEPKFEDGTPDWSKEISMLEAALAKAEGR